MKKIMFVFVFVMLLFSTSFGYTLTIQKGDYTLVREGIQSGTSISFGLNGPAVWSADIDSLEINRTDYTSAEMLMPESNVTITLDDGIRTSDLARGEYIKITAGSSSIINTIWRVQSVSNGVVSVSPVASLGNLRLAGSSGYNSAATYKSNNINALISTGYFVSGNISQNTRFTYQPNYNFWGFDQSTQVDTSYSGNTGTGYLVSYYDAAGGKWKKAYLDSSLNQSVYEYTCGLCFLMVLSNGYSKLEGSGTEADPYLINFVEFI